MTQSQPTSTHRGTRCVIEPGKHTQTTARPRDTQRQLEQARRQREINMRASTNGARPPKCNREKWQAQGGSDTCNRRHAEHRKHHQKGWPTGRAVQSQKVCHRDGLCSAGGLAKLQTANHVVDKSGVNFQYGLTTMHEPVHKKCCCK